MKEKNNMVIIILLIILLCVVGVFAYKWYSNTTVCPKCDNENDVKVNTEVNVVDAINTTPKYFAHSASNNIKIVIPKIVGNGKNIEVLNKTILDEIISYMIVPLGSEDDVANIDVSYKSTIKNDIVNILVTTKMDPWNASGNGISYYNYFYDIKNDKVLTATESLEKNGYTDSKYLSEFTKCNDGNDEITNCSIDHIKKVINENHNCTYIDIDNNDLKVYFDDFCN